MYNIKGIDQLRARVQVLEQQQAAGWKGLKSNVNEHYERLKPANLIRNAFEGLVETIDPDSDILEEGAGLVSGMIVNSIMSGSKNKPLKKWLTLVLFSVATYFISKHREEIVEAGHKVVKYVSDKLNSIQKKKHQADTDDDGDGVQDEAPSFPDEDVDVVMP